MGNATMRPTRASTQLRRRNARSFPPRPRESCALHNAQTAALDLRSLPKDERRDVYARRCRRTGCASCGPHDASRWAKRQASKAATIDMPSVHQILPWPVLPIARSSIHALRDFLDACELLHDALTEGDVGEPPSAWVLVPEYAALNSAQVRPHVHLVYVAPSRGTVPRAGEIARCWTQLGGAVDRTHFSGRRMAPTTRYLAKGPLGKQIDTPSGESLARHLLDPYENETGQRCARPLVGGLAMRAWESQKLRARARYEKVIARRPPRRGRRPQDPDARYASFLPALKVQYVIRCPKCRAHGSKIVRNGRSGSGKQRLLCKSCRKTFYDKPVMEGRAAADQRRRERSYARRLHSSGMPLRQISARLCVSYRTVRAYVHHPHAAPPGQATPA